MLSRIAVASWSLQARDAQDLAAQVRACGLDAVQLALDPVRTRNMPIDALRAGLEQQGIGIVSGMMAMHDEDYTTLASIRRTGGIVSDATWPRNLAAARANAVTARELALTLVTFHAGIVPHPHAETLRRPFLQRLRTLRDTFAAEGIRIALETGQEDAAALQALLADLPEVGINFDPANLVLYDSGDPAEALAALLPRVAQLHVKDAVRTETPGTWGREVPVGEGDVAWPVLLPILQGAHHQIDLVIEREAGEARVADVQRALAVLRTHGV
jgi:sugar phosphate isomerase/epimerase